MTMTQHVEQLKHSFSLEAKHRLLPTLAAKPENKAMLKHQKNETAAFADRLQEAFSYAESKSAVARACGVSDQAVTGWLKTGRVDKRHIPVIAELTGFNAMWIFTGEGPKRIEESLTNVQPGPEIKGRVPRISWVRAGSWTEAVDIFEPGEAEDWIECPFPHSDLSFALRVEGISMEPEFREGDIIIVDPTRPHDPGKYVIAKKNATNEATFKQLFKEGDEFYLKATNPDWPEKIIRMNEEWSVSGVIVGKMKAY